MRRINVIPERWRAQVLLGLRATYPGSLISSRLIFQLRSRIITFAKQGKALSSGNFRDDGFFRFFPTTLSLLIHVLALAYFLQQTDSIPGNTPPPAINVIFVSSATPQLEIALAPEKPQVKTKPATKRVVAKPSKAPPIQLPSSANERPMKAAPAILSNTPPRYRAGSQENPLPTYPYVSRRRGEEGRVTCEVKVAPNGKAEAITLKESSGFSRLDEAAQKVLSTWIFMPATRGPDKIYGFVEISITFLLTEGVKI